MNVFQSEILLPGGQDGKQFCTSCCISLLKGVMPMITVKEGCSHSFIFDGSIDTPTMSKRSNDISCCESGAAETPPVCNEFNDILAADVSNKRQKGQSSPKLSDEPVLVLVAQHTNWNPRFLCFLSCICKKMNAISNRILWREFCRSRAPQMVSDLLLGSRNGHIDGGWQALGKLFLYCSGCCHSNRNCHFVVPNIAAHFVPRTRFSRTSGRSFLLPWCRTDVLYMSDICEHANDPEDVGVFRGVLKAFDKSKIKKLITDVLRFPLEAKEKCPFCKARVWSMGRAHMIPRSASTKLAAFNDNVEYFVCLNGHVNGRCALLHLSDTDTSDTVE